MELINLPVLPDDTSLRAALAVLRSATLSGLVTVRNDDVLLVRAGDLYKAMSLQKKSVGEAPSTSVAAQFVVRNPVFKHGLRWTITVGAAATSQRIGERGMHLMPPSYVAPPEPLSDYTLAAMDVGVATILTAS